MSRMQELLDQCRQLCEEFDSHSYTLAASSPAGPLGGVTDTVGGTISGATGSVTGVTDKLLGGGEEKQQR
jgi:hypothetical protein